jgi:fumarylacetoacetase
MTALNATHDAARKSWVETANAPSSDFPIQNLPYGVFSTAGTAPRVGVAIGDQILDLSVLEATGLLKPDAKATVFNKHDINAYMALGPSVWSATRAAISDLLETKNPKLRDNAALRANALVPMGSAKLHLPLFVRSFTDFFSSKEHATNTGSMLRDPANALTPNWLHMPIAYNSRASTVVVSGTDIRRPLGQSKAPTADVPSFGPSRRLDIELEMGAIVGTPSTMGEPLTTAESDAIIFGYVILNDWSARDIQAWEGQPLGPFQAKVFATTISPWIVTAEALAPYRVKTPDRVKPLLPYLHETAPYNFDIHLEFALQPAGAAKPTTLARTNYKYMYYSAAQQLTHHAIGGCAMCTGDIIGSGTISGPTKDSLGSMLELSMGGKTPMTLDGGIARSFLEDGDTVTLSGHAQGTGHRIGFGTCAGTILPASQKPFG